MDMKWTPWILGSLTAVILAACGGGADRGTTGGAETETGAGTGAVTDTATMAPGAATTDTAMSGDTGMSGADTAPTR
jgi:hypothetical protein